MAKGGREKIKLESTAGTGHFYTTTKNKRTMPEKMEIMKFDPKARKHVSYNRDFIAFPKNNAGRDVMLDAPSVIDAHQFEELQLQSTVNNK